ncbi:hypothetical protein D3C85_1724340 [compost metagenome]
MGIQVVHGLLGKQRGVGGHDEFDELARLAEPLFTIVDHVLDQLAIAQRFAAENTTVKRSSSGDSLSSISTEAMAVSTSIFLPAEGLSRSSL